MTDTSNLRLATAQSNRQIATVQTIFSQTTTESSSTSGFSYDNHEVRAEINAFLLNYRVASNDYLAGKKVNFDDFWSDDVDSEWVSPYGSKLDQARALGHYYQYDNDVISDITRAGDIIWLTVPHYVTR